MGSGGVSTWNELGHRTGANKNKNQESKRGKAQSQGSLSLRYELLTLQLPTPEWELSREQQCWKSAPLAPSMLYALGLLVPCPA